MDPYVKARFIVFFLCFMVNLGRHALLESWNASKPQIEDELSFSSIVLGGIDMVFLFSYAAGNVINGILSDKYNPKTILNIGMIVASIAGCCVNFI